MGLDVVAALGVVEVIMMFSEVETEARVTSSRYLEIGHGSTADYLQLVRAKAPVGWADGVRERLLIHWIIGFIRDGKGDYCRLGVDCNGIGLNGSGACSYPG